MIVIRVTDQTVFEDYEREVMQRLIDAPGPPVHVVWDLRDLTRVPWELLGAQVALMKRIRERIWQRIVKSTIVTSSESTRSFLNAIFSLYTPMRPVQIASEMPYDPPNTSR